MSDSFLLLSFLFLHSRSEPATPPGFLLKIDFPDPFRGHLDAVMVVI